MPLTLTPLPGIPLVQPGDDLVALLSGALERAQMELEEGDILVLTSKIVSKAEGRLVNLREVQPSARAVELAGQVEKDPRLVELILQESREVLRTRPGTIIVEHRLGFVCANAGIDHSNICGEGNAQEEWVQLLPLDPDASARRIRQGLEDAIWAPSAGAHAMHPNSIDPNSMRPTMGVMIVDSHGRAWRQGTVGVAIGLAGLPGLVDLRGAADLFDYTLRITLVGAADELAAGASLVMGQAAEGTPVVHARGFPYPLREGSLGELLRPRDKDLFR